MFVLYNDVALNDKQKKHLCVLRELYEQQKHMYDNKTHKVKDRIVSISQPYIRPIVRGKTKSPVEFGAKLDMSIDEKGFARLKKVSFDAYNEEDVPVTAIENYRKRTGHYPERVLVDQIYRNQKNRAYCKTQYYDQVIHCTFYSRNESRQSGKSLFACNFLPDILVETSEQ